MILLLIFLDLLLAQLTRSVIIHNPLHYNDQGLDRYVARELLSLSRGHNVNFKDRKLSRRIDQAPFTTEHSHQLEVWDAPFPNQLIAPAALGNPPQPFRLLVDLAWDTLFVPSTSLDSFYTGNDEILRYSSNQSSTFIPGQTHLVTACSGVRFGGDLAHDTFRLAGLEVPHQPFLNAQQATPQGFIHFWFGYEGVLGLAPRWNTSIDETLTPSPWSSIMNQSLIDNSIIALDIPRGPRHISAAPRTGSISFGGISPKYAHSNFTTLALSNYTDRAWTVPATSLTLLNATHPLHETFNHTVLAGFDSTAWYLGLPRSWAKAIYASIPHECGFIWCFIDCADRQKLPDLVFRLAGQKFTLTAFDYALELVTQDKQRLCSFEIYSTEGMYEVGAIVLGPHFMNAFYTVFDADEKEVRVTEALE